MFTSPALVQAEQLIKKNVPNMQVGNEMQLSAIVGTEGWALLSNDERQMFGKHIKNDPESYGLIYCGFSTAQNAVYRRAVIGAEIRQILTSCVQAMEYNAARELSSILGQDNWNAVGSDQDKRLFGKEARRYANDYRLIYAGDNAAKNATYTRAGAQPMGPA